MIIKNVRFSYLNVFSPREFEEGDGKPMYSVSLLIPKDSETAKQVREAIDAAAKSGVSKGVYKAGALKAPGFRNPLRDGDKEREEDPDRWGPEYAEVVWLNAKKRATDKNGNVIPGPGCVDKHLRPIMPEDQGKYWSGYYGHADVSFYAYNYRGACGIGVGLNNIMFTREGECLSGQMDAVSAFTGLEVEESDSTAEDFE